MGIISLEDLKSPKKLGIFIVIVGGIQFIIVTVIAMFFYPGGYSFIFNYFSALGRTMTAATHTLPNTPNPISSVMFFIAIMIAAISIIPFFIIIRTLFKDEKRTNIIAWTGSIAGLAASPFLMGVALFPSDLFPGGTGLHGISALFFFLMFAIAIIIYSIAILLKDDYQNGYAIFGLVLAVFAILYAVKMFDFIGLGVIDALMQKSVVYSFIVWALIQGIKVWQVVET